MRRPEFITLGGAVAHWPLGSNCLEFGARRMPVTLQIIYLSTFEKKNFYSSFSGSRSAL